MQTIYKKGDKLVIEIPMMVKRNDVYDPKPGMMNNIIGTIAGDDIGFSYLIDMEYKGKEDQISANFFTYSGEAKEFKKLCSELGIELFEYPICSECREVIYGVHQWGKKGPVCSSCQDD